MQTDYIQIIISSVHFYKMKHCFHFIITCLAVIRPDYILPERKLAFTGDKPCYVKQVWHIATTMYTHYTASQKDRFHFHPPFLCPIHQSTLQEVRCCLIRDEPNFVVVWFSLFKNFTTTT